MTLMLEEYVSVLTDTFKAAIIAKPLGPGGIGWMPEQVLQEFDKALVSTAAYAVGKAP